MSEVDNLVIVPESGETPIPSTQSNSKLNVGEQLLLARTKQNLSVEQIAGQLKWSLRQITEIEAGNYAVLRDQSGVRGLVRSYAKILKLDVDQLLSELSVEFAMFPAQFPAQFAAQFSTQLSTKVVDRPLLNTPFPAGRMPWLGRQNNRTHRIFGGLFLVLLCLTVFFVYRNQIIQLVRTPLAQTEITANPGGNRVLTTTVETRDSVVDDASRVVSSIDQVAYTSAEPLPLTASLKVKDVPSVQTNVLPAITKIKPVNSVSDGVQEQKARLEKQHTNQKSSNGVLVLNFKQDSWVQIKRLNGEKVVSHLYKAGTNEAIDVHEPLNLIIGYAPGVEAELRGKKLALQTQDKSNVVSLNIK